MTGRHYSPDNAIKIGLDDMNLATVNRIHGMLIDVDPDNVDFP
ncbi:hypothetical protein FGKAn22_23290 [Ferrigenium kumadai]|uniref:Uncharacterized protein n=1 Tax=Ferrigenium kumadai TaxID=1682490 RepID=A0AAN1T1H3_9PROT|nr:hypothetical protein FGKAn22_23290 [Ferrigenium kumadai]